MGKFGVRVVAVFAAVLLVASCSSGKGSGSSSSRGGPVEKSVWVEKVNTMCNKMESASAGLGEGTDAAAMKEVGDLLDKLADGVEGAGSPKGAEADAKKFVKLLRDAADSMRGFGEGKTSEEDMLKVAFTFAFEFDAAAAKLGLDECRESPSDVDPDASSPSTTTDLFDDDSSMGSDDSGSAVGSDGSAWAASANVVCEKFFSDNSELFGTAVAKRSFDDIPEVADAFAQFWYDLYDISDPKTPEVEAFLSSVQDVVNSTEQLRAAADGPAADLDAEWQAFASALTAASGTASAAGADACA